MTDPTHGQDGQGDTPPARRPLIRGRWPKPVGNDTVDLAEAMDAHEQGDTPLDRVSRGLVDALRPHMAALGLEATRALEALGEVADGDYLTPAEQRAIRDQAHAAGYAAAVAELRGVVQRTGSPAARWAADYLETVGPGAGVRCTCPRVDVSTFLDDPSNPPTVKGYPDPNCPTCGTGARP